MKPFAIFALTLILTAATLVGCGCTNQNMDTDTMPTVLPTNEEIWNSTETTIHDTTGSTTVPATNDGTLTETTDETRNINETEVKNHVNDYTEMMDKILEKEKAEKSSAR